MFLFIAWPVRAQHQVKLPLIDNLAYSGTMPVPSGTASYLFIACDQATKPEDLKQWPLQVIASTVGGSALHLTYSGLGPLKLTESGLTRKQNSLSKFTNILSLDIYGHGYSRANGSLPSNLTIAGQALAQAITTFLKTSLGNAFRKVSLVLQGPLARLLPGMYDIGAILESVTWLSPWPDFYTLGKYYGAAGAGFKLISSIDKAITESSMQVCYRQRLNKNYSLAFSCYQDTLDYLEKKANQTDLNDVTSKSLSLQYTRVQAYFSTPEMHALLNLTERFDSMGGSLAIPSDLGNGNDSSLQLTYFLKDFPECRLLVMTGQSDLVGYGGAVRDWLDNQLDFIEKKDWNRLNYTDWVVGQAKVGLQKAVGQVRYYSKAGFGGRVWQSEEVVGLVKGVIEREAQLQK